MNKKLWLIDYENAHWCGGQLNVVVWAETADEALYLAEGHMEDEQRELFSDHAEEQCEEDEDDSILMESFVSVNSVVEFNEDHDEWKFFQMPGQSSFYPVIGEP